MIDGLEKHKKLPLLQFQAASLPSIFFFIRVLFAADSHSVWVRAVSSRLSAPILEGRADAAVREVGDSLGWVAIGVREPSDAELEDS